MKAFWNNLFKNISSSMLCALYALASILSVSVISLIEGSLVGTKTITTPTGVTTASPFLSNYSTVLDFILLNPITIYFLDRAVTKCNNVVKELNEDNLLYPHHFLGILSISSIVAGIMMSYYYKGFLAGDFIDSVVSIDTHGNTFITNTGWFVYFWTALFIAILFFKTIQISLYVFFILRIKEESLVYRPYHEDEAAGLSKIMSPLITYSYGMITLLIIFLVFAVYDLKLDIDESNRLYTFYLYLAIIIPLFFFPFWKLHNLMILKRKKYLITMGKHVSTFPENINFQSLANDSSKLKELCENVENFQKLRNTFLSFPIWPVPIRNVLGLQLMAIVISLLPQITKLTTLFTSSVVS